MRDKIQMNRREISDLADDTALLMGRVINGRLTIEQAELTLSLFPDTEEAIAVANGYFSIPKKERDEAYSGYISFLEAVEEACFKVRSTYEQEVAERTSRVPRESLMQEGYRDKPYNSGHFYEHLVTRMTG